MSKEHVDTMTLSKVHNTSAEELELKFSILDFLTFTVDVKDPHSVQKEGFYDAVFDIFSSSVTDVTRTASCGSKSSFL